MRTSTEFNHSKASFYILCGVILSYPFSIKMCNGLILCLTLNWIIWLIRKPSELQWKWVILVLISPVLFSAFSTLYSEHQKAAFFVLEKKMSLFLLPIVFGTMPKFDRDDFNVLRSCSVVAALLSILFCFLAAAFRKLNGIPGGFFWSDFIKPIDFHPTNFGLFINFITFWLGYYLIEEWHLLKGKRKIIIVLCLIIFYSTQILISSKIQIIFSGAIFIIQLIWLMKLTKSKIILGLSIVLVLSGLWFSYTGYVWERFTHIDQITYQIDAPPQTFNEFTIRLALIECSWEVLKNHFIWGVGEGDVYTELEKVYYLLDYKFGYLDKQNPHNEYLSQALGTGFMGLGFFILSLFILFKNALKRKNATFIVLIVLLAATFFIESVLQVQKGIVLFALYMPFFFFHGYEHRQLIPLDKN